MTKQNKKVSRAETQAKADKAARAKQASLAAQESPGKGKSRTEKKVNTAVFECAAKCRNPFQDKQNGGGRRVHNRRQKKGESAAIWYCTGCGNKKTI